MIAHGNLIIMWFTQEVERDREHKIGDKTNLWWSSWFVKLRESPYIFLWFVSKKICFPFCVNLLFKNCLRTFWRWALRGIETRVWEKFARNFKSSKKKFNFSHHTNTSTPLIPLNASILYGKYRMDFEIYFVTYLPQSFTFFCYITFFLVFWVY